MPVGGRGFRDSAWRRQLRRPHGCAIRPAGNGDLFAAPHASSRERHELRLDYPNGEHETPVSVPHYDFSWETIYFEQKPIEVRKDAKIELFAHWDNSANNKYNPDPKATIRWGGSGGCAARYRSRKSDAETGEYRLCRLVALEVLCRGRSSSQPADIVTGGKTSAQCPAPPPVPGVRCFRWDFQPAQAGFPVTLVNRIG